VPSTSSGTALAGTLRRLKTALTGKAPAGKPTGRRKWKASRRRGSPTSRFEAQPGDRLLKNPVFVLSSVRSGSTLIRMMLNSHSAIHAPHELHLGSIHVQVGNKWASAAMEELSLDAPQLEHLLWDRLLHRELTRHGKTVLVNKTPSDAFRWRRILECWPDARFIFLLRHPAAVAESWSRAHPNWPAESVEKDVLRYMLAVERARNAHEGLTVKYEDVTRHPEAEMKRICEFIGVDWEPAMIDYGQADHGTFRRGIGDWSEQIRSGKVQPVIRLPDADEIPDLLRDISVKWGYVPE
jgi:LPS sulfotransferase NodH